MLTTDKALICTKIGIFIEEVVVNHECDIRAQLLIVILVVDSLTNRLAELEVGVDLLILDLRAVDVGSVPILSPIITGVLPNSTV